MNFLYPLDPKYIRPDNTTPSNNGINKNGGHYGRVRKNSDGSDKYHSGVDYTAPIGSNVYSAGSGKIIYSGYNNSYGNCVIIKHYDGTSTLYAHMEDKPLLKVGESVVGRVKLGEVGKTGNAVGKNIEPHLHFEYLNEKASE